MTASTGCSRPGASGEPSPINHNGFRDYLQPFGRYVQADPSGLAGGLNPYAYAKNNPLKNTDRLGLNPTGTASQTADNSGAQTSQQNAAANSGAGPATQGSGSQILQNCPTCTDVASAEGGEGNGTFFPLPTEGDATDMDYKNDEGVPGNDTYEQNLTIANGTDMAAKTLQNMANQYQSNNTNDGGVGDPGPMPSSANWPNPAFPSSNSCDLCFPTGHWANPSPSSAPSMRNP